MTEPNPQVDALFKKKGFWIGAVLIGGGTVYYFRQRAKANAATTTATPDTTTDPNASSDPNAYDSTYGDGGYSPIDSQNLGGYGGIGQGAYTYDPNTGEYYPNGGSPSSTGNTFSSNNDWAQAAESALQGAGYNSASAAVAIGKYLLKQPLTSDQGAIVQAAIGLVGFPPDSPGSPSIAPPGAVNTSTALTPPKLTLKSQDAKTKKAVLVWTKPANAFQFHLYKDGKLVSLYLGTTATVSTPGTYTVVASPTTSGTTVGKYHSSVASNAVKVTV